MNTWAGVSLRAGHQANWLAVNKTLPSCFINNLYHAVAVPCYLPEAESSKILSLLQVIENMILLATGRIITLVWPRIFKFAQWCIAETYMYVTHESPHKMRQNYMANNSIFFCCAREKIQRYVVSGDINFESWYIERVYQCFVDVKKCCEVRSKKSFASNFA